SSSRPSSADKDERYYEAVEVIVGQQRGSATLIQRALSVGYTRATRLLELMEEDGIVGPFVGAKSREVLLTHEEWQARREAEEQAADEDGFEYEDDDESVDESEVDGGDADGAEDAAAAAADSEPA
ncbi:MAG: DNA translocase FtsK, partial [Planctomycetota bacterium]